MKRRAVGTADAALVLECAVWYRLLRSYCQLNSAK
jgi:hypothetical protein